MAGIDLSPEQQRVLNVLLAEGQKIKDPRARRVYQRAAVETGLVESGLTNPSGGDADSAGWRQERASIYADPTNLHASASRFRQEFLDFYKPGMHSWDVAAAVQRPAAQYRGRYKDRAGDAAAIIQAYDGSTGGGSTGGTTSTPTVPHGLSAGDPAQSLTSAMPAGNPAAAAALIQQLSASRRQPVASSSLQPPAVTAGPVLPDAYRALTSTQGPAPRQDIGALLSMVQTQGADLGAGPAQSDAGGAQTPAAGPGGGPATPSAPKGPAKYSGLVPLGGSKNAGKGSFSITGPSPDRLKPALTSYADKVAYIYGGSLTGLDGSTHSKFTVNGKVSEHYTGNATDVFGIGGLKYGQDGWTQQLVRAGRAALIAAGMPRAQALKQTGGLYNVGNHQIIFNVNGTQYGGNHLDHLHISTHA